EPLPVFRFRAFLQVDEVVWRQNVHFQGEDRKQGDILREPGSWLSPAEISVAAKIGQDQLQVSRLPRIALVSSGDELVEIAATPLPYQIRRSNLYMLQAALREWQIEAQAFHLPDHPDTILAALQDIRDQFDVMILSGGVSKGKADYIPEALEKLGVTKHFHRIAQRPGKPLWYGEIPDQLQVFALPGNPVSTFIGFNRYVRPWLLQSLGAPLPRPAYARLAKEVLFKPDLTYFLQVRLEMDETGVLLAQPIEGHGSGDLANLMDCDGFLELPQGKNHFQAGESYPLIPYRTLRQM
ncbi:MAG: molybdopterin molybdotransferase MoeA, partial [Bacteroidota bacterium]